MCSSRAAISRAPARATRSRVFSGNPGSCPLQSGVCGQAILRTYADHACHSHGGHPGHRQVQLPMHVCPGWNSHPAPSPRDSDWFSVEPSTQPHMRREARSHLAAYLRTMVYQSQHLFGAQLQVTRQLHWRLCFKLTFTALPSCWNRWGLRSSSSMWATPSKIWQIRGPHTAGRLSTLLSGARSRSALATKYAHPARAVQMALDQLRSIYLSAGYKLADLQHLFHLPATPTRKNL